VSFDLLNSQEKFAGLRIYVEKKFPIDDEEFNTKYGFTPSRDSFFSIPWDSNLIYFLRKEEFSQAPVLISKYPGLFLLSLEEVPEKYSPFVYSLSSESKEVIKTLDFIRNVIMERKKAELMKEAQLQSVRLFREASQYITEVEKMGRSEMSEVIRVFLKLDNELLLEKKLNDFIKKSQRK